MACCSGILRSFPTNYLFLFCFTAFEGVMIGFISAAYTWQSVVLAAGITLVVFLGLTVYCCTTTTDFTGYHVYFFSLLLALSVFGTVLFILAMCGVHILWLTILYDCLGVLVFVGYIIF